MSNHNQYSSNDQYPYGPRSQRPHPQQYAQPYGYPGGPPHVPPPPPPPQDAPDRGSYPGMRAYRGQLYDQGPGARWGPAPSYDQRGDVRTLDEPYGPPYGPPQVQRPGQSIGPQQPPGAPPPQQPPPPYDFQRMQPPKFEYDYAAAPSRSSNNVPPPPPPPPQPQPFDEAKYRSRAENAFNYFDRNQSGHLDFQEFQEALRFLNLDILIDDARRHFYGADLDGNQRISKNEFVDMYVQQRRSWYHQQYQAEVKYSPYALPNSR